MFKISQKPTYKWPVTVSIPDDGGKFTKGTFTAEFKALSQDEIDTIIKAGRDGDETSDILHEALIGWSAVQDADGSDLPYSEEAKAKLLRMAYVRFALLDAFFNSINGGGARRKN